MASKQSFCFAIMLATCVLLPVGGASAADMDGKYAIVGRGADGCAKYLEAREGASLLWWPYTLWLDGYMTASNSWRDDTYSLTGGENIDSLLASLDKYCRENPLDTVADAARSLVFELYPGRVREAPE